MSIDRITTATLGCVLGGAALLAALNLFAPTASAVHVPDFVISLTGKYLSYAILAESFPKEVAGRANGALNVFHHGGAFALQYATGLILG